MNIDANSTQDKATLLRISNLEKRLLQQVQTNREILHHLKVNKDAHKQRCNNPKDLLHPLSEVVVDLTNNDSFSPEKYPTPTKKRGRQNIQWVSTIKHVQQYNPEMTPKQLFAPSTTLSHATPFSGQKTQNFGQPTTFSGQTNPFLHQTPPFLHQTPPVIHYPSQGQLQPNFNHTTTPFYHNQTASSQPQTMNSHHNMGQMLIPPNPFTNPTHYITKRPREEKYKGRRRGFSQRN
jgi:hypothetical protein